MDLLQNRKALGAAAALGFGLSVAWMMPPTDPRPLGPNWRAYVKPVAPPAPVDFAGFAPAMAAMPSYRVDPYAYAGDDGAGDVQVHRGRSDEEDMAPAVDPAADRDDMTETVAGPAPGYRWVERHNIGDSRLCGAAPN